MRPSTSYTHNRRKAHSFFAASRKLSKGKGKSEDQGQGQGQNKSEGENACFGERAERQKIGAGKIEKKNKKTERYGKTGKIDG